MSEPDKKRKLFEKLETREDALKVVKDSAMVCFFLAVIMGAVSFVIGKELLIDAGMYLAIGLFLFFYKSRAAAVIFLIAAGLSMAATIGNLAGAKLGGGSNIIVAIIVMYAAIRAVQATFQLKNKFADVDQPTERL